MQTDEDAARMRSLGIAPERVRDSGNIKFDSEEAEGSEALTRELRERFGLDGERPLFVAASTHSPEERVVLEAFRLAAGAAPGRRPRVLIAPRHPERFAEVASRLEASGLSWARRSGARREADAGCDVILLDTIGELRAAYPLAEVVFVGGSIARTGGHNVLEPALAARCVVTGAHTFNFTAIVRSFLEQGALVQLPPLEESDAPQALASVLTELLGDEEKRRAIGERARAALEMNRGATARTVRMLAPIFEERSEVRGQRSVKDKMLASSL
jgi:3-deoxy-D-manno-octulosonic-acid transferase